MPPGALIQPILEGLVPIHAPPAMQPGQQCCPQDAGPCHSWHSRFRMAIAVSPCAPLSLLAPPPPSGLHPVSPRPHACGFDCLPHLTALLPGLFTLEPYCTLFYVCLSLIPDTSCGSAGLASYAVSSAPSRGPQAASPGLLGPRRPAESPATARVSAFARFFQRECPGMLHAGRGLLGSSP